VENTSPSHNGYVTGTKWGSSFIGDAAVQMSCVCLYEDDRRRINATEMDALRRSARISKLERKTNEYTRTWKKQNGRARYNIGRDNSITTYLVWTCRENGPKN